MEVEGTGGQGLERSGKKQLTTTPDIEQWYCLFNYQRTA